MAVIVVVSRLPKKYPAAEREVLVHAQQCRRRVNLARSRFLIAMEA